MNPKTKRVGMLMVLASAAAILWVLGPPRFSLSPGAPEESGPAVSRTIERIYFGPPNSLAILLPTSSNSGGEQTHVAKGLAIHLANRLAAESRLHVLSPNSSFYFPPGELDQRVMAERLTARHLLFLEFAPAGDLVTATARLYDARRERDLAIERVSGDSWFDFSRRLPEWVLTAMSVPTRLGPPRPLADEALLPYLAGLAALYDGDPSSARDAFEQSLAASQNFGDAQVGLARALLASPAGALSEDPIDQARDLLRRALQRDPGHGRALALRAHIEFRHDWQFGQSLDSARRAVAQLPGDAAALSIAATSALSLGAFEQAVEWQQAAVDRDPLNLWLLLSLGHAQEYAGEFDAALSTFRQVIILNSDLPAAAAFRARIKLLQDKPQVALEEAEVEPDPFWARYATILSLFSLKREAEASELLHDMIEEDAHRAAIQIAEIQAWRGQPDAAFDWLDRALQQRDGGLAELSGNRLFAALNGDSRWAALLDRLGLPLLDSERDSD